MGSHRFLTLVGKWGVMSDSEWGVVGNGKRSVMSDSKWGVVGNSNWSNGLGNSDLGDGWGLTVNNGVESVDWVSSVGDGTDGTIGLHKGVLSLDDISVPRFVGGLGVSGQTVRDGVSVVVLWVWVVWLRGNGNSLGNWDGSLKKWSVSNSDWSGSEDWSCVGNGNWGSMGIGGLGIGNWSVGGISDWSVDSGSSHGVGVLGLSIAIMWRSSISDWSRSEDWSSDGSLKDWSSSNGVGVLGLGIGISWGSSISWSCAKDWGCDSGLSVGDSSGSNTQEGEEGHDLDHCELHFRVEEWKMGKIFLCVRQMR